MQKMCAASKRLWINKASRVWPVPLFTLLLLIQQDLTRIELKYLMILERHYENAATVTAQLIVYGD